jgi:hypothetical protein
MKKKYHLGAIMLFLICLAIVVVLFPLAFDNKRIYEGLLLTSIAIVILLMLFLIKVNVLDSK